MTKKIVFGVVVALVIVGLAAPSASANCAGSKFVSLYNPTTGGSAYWHSTLSGPGTTLVAKVWQPGGADVTGTCNTRNNADGNLGILYFGATPGDIGLNYNLSDACVQPATACANGQVAVMATVTGSKPATPLIKETEFLTSQAPETNGDFFFDSFGAHALVPIPRPRITGSSRAGAIVNTNITVDASSAGAYEGTAGLITGYNILSKLAGSDPGRSAAAYDAGPTLAASGGTAVSSPIAVDCTGSSVSLSRRFVVVQLVTAAGGSPTVSQATQVGCDPSLADPKFTIVPKKKFEPNSKAKH